MKAKCVAIAGEEQGPLAATTSPTAGLLRAAQNEQAAAKLGAYGPQGSGKTTTLAMLALGLAITYHDKAPVAMHDTENGSDFLAPMFAAEGVALLVHKSRAFADMVGSLEEAERAGCCAFLADSITQTWLELIEGYRTKRKIARIEFHHWQDIKGAWRGWVDRYLNSRLHCLIAGRAGHEYEFQENAEGRKELIKGGSKMKAESEFGYEPSLLFEMEAVREAPTPTRSGRGRYIHTVRVLKDRTRALQGRTFAYRDLNAYKPSDWKKVFRDFQPHFAWLNIGGTQRALEPASSEALFEEDRLGEAYRRRQSRAIALEEIESTLVLLWPGQDARSKRIKLLVLGAVFEMRSWTAIQSLPLEKIERGLALLRGLERKLKSVEPESEEEFLELLGSAKRDAPS